MHYNHTFYEVMKYPIPEGEGKFSYGGEWVPKNWTKQDEQGSGTAPLWSWQKDPSPLMEEFEARVRLCSKFFPFLPFVEQVYVCNGMSFNALKDSSDIDFLVIARNGKMWLARFFVTGVFMIFWLKRMGDAVRKRVCLSFWLTQKSRNIYSLTLQGGDVYFHYWLLHLVPIYTKRAGDEKKIWESNQWLKEYFPLADGEQSIFLDVPMVVGENILRRCVQWLLMRFFWGILGEVGEWVVKHLWLPVMRYKQRKLKEKRGQVIISDDVMKFYDDKRKSIQVLYQVAYKGHKA